MKDDEFYGYEGKWEKREEIQCPDCGVMFFPNPDNEEFCTRCNAIHEINVEREYDEGDY